MERGKEVTAMHICMLWHDELSPPVLPEILGVPWRKLPQQRGREGKARLGKFKNLWWRATDYGQHLLSPEFMARLPELLAAAQREDENDKREDAADIARSERALEPGATAAL
jgi:hypothetical protein